MNQNQITCPICAHTYAIRVGDSDTGRICDHVPCPLCAGQWEIWELRFSPMPLAHNRAQIASWLGQMPFPSAIDLVATESGIRVRLFTPPGSAQGVIRS
jgi:hypothetical protein